MSRGCQPGPLVADLAEDGAACHFPKGWVTDPGMKALKESETVLNCDTFAGFALEAKHGDMQRPPWVKTTVFR